MLLCASADFLASRAADSYDVPSRLNVSLFLPPPDPPRPRCHGFAARDEQIATQRVTLARFRAVAAQEGAVQTAGKTNSAVEAGDFLPGKNEGVVNADLQTRLKSTIEQGGARLRSVRVLPGQTIDQVRYIGSRIEIYGSLPAIHRAIHAVEAAKPHLFIASAGLKPAPPAGKPGTPEEPVIEAQLEIFGATRIEGSSR